MTADFGGVYLKYPFTSTMRWTVVAPS